MGTEAGARAPRTPSGFPWGTAPEHWSTVTLRCWTENVGVHVGVDATNSARRVETYKTLRRSVGLPICPLDSNV